MNKFKIALFCIVTFLSINIYAGKPVYSIKVRFTNLKDTVCYLGHYYGDKTVIKDTSKVDAKGLSIFESDERLPGGIYLIITPSKRYFEFIMDKDLFMTFEGADTLDFVKSLRIKGSPDNQLFYEYLKYISAKSIESEPLRTGLRKKEQTSDSITYYTEKLNKINEDVKQYKLNFIAAHPASFLTTIFNASYEPDVPEAPLLENGKRDSIFVFNYYKKHYFDKISLTDDRLLRTPILYNKIKTYLTQLTLQHPDSIIKEADFLVNKARENREMFKYLVWYITNYSETSSIMGFDAIFVHMVETYYMTNQAYWVSPANLEKITNRARILKNILLGKVAPNLIMQDTNMVYHALHDVKSKYTILFFWDPTCGHCQTETPLLKELFNKTQNKGVEVYAVCTDPNINDWKKFIIEKKLNWLNVMDLKNVTAFHTIYDIFSTPVLYILDENKKILAKRLSVEQAEQFLNDQFLLNEKKL